MVKKILTFAALFAATINGINAQTAASAVDGKKQTLFSSVNHTSTPYRIPAVATLNNGTVLAIADQRPCGADVGNGEVDIYAKVGTIAANGSYSWNPASTDPSNDGTGLRIANGTGNDEFDCGFGDAAVVVDRESGKVLVISVAGKVVFSDGSSSKHNNMARIVGSADGLSWESPEDVTTAFFNNLLPNAYTMFMASGRMVQSQLVKVGNYYRIYGALLVREKGGFLNLGTSNNNYVVYSDDLGATWKVLGGGKAVEGGDEAKVEELPNGDIVLSSRTSGGRYYNVFKFTNPNDATGSWGDATKCSFAGSNSTNGELLFYKGLVKDSDNKEYNVMFQSLPTGSSRSNVAVYYKAFATDKSSWSVSDFTSGWTKGIEVDNSASGYSTMTILPNGQVGFLYEDDYDTNKASGDYSNIVYVPLTVEEITGGAFTYVASSEPQIPTVATPSITPKGGKIFDTQAITLNCNTEGAAIYYTIDGTEPTTSSTLYTNPFTLNESATVKAIAVKEEYNNSGVASVAFDVTKAGTTYRFKNVQKNGVCYYFTYDATNGIGLTTNVEDAALYIRREGTTAGTYTYQTIDGNYLIFSGRDLGGQSTNKGYNDGKGFLTAYEAAKCDLTIAKMVAGGNVESFDGEYYTIKGQRDYKKNSFSGTTQEQAYFVITSDGKFDGATSAYYNDNYSSAFVIEEVSVAPQVNKVATPVFSIPSGAYDEGTELTITCATEGARIYVAADPAWPAEEWIDVTVETIRLYEDFTIYAIAKLDGWKDSEIASAEFTINETVEPEPEEPETPVDPEEPEEPETPAVNEYPVTPVTGYIGNTQYHIATFSASETTVAPIGVSVYYVKSAGNDVISLTKASSRIVPANTGVILIARGNTPFHMTSTTDYAAPLNDNLLAGTIDSEKNVKGYYVLALKGSGELAGKFAFCRVTTDHIISANRAYLNISATAASNSANIRLTIDGTTDIEGVDADENAPIEYYNLQGVKVENPEKGIYIKRQGTTVTKVML